VDGRIGGEMGPLRAGQVPVRTGGVVARGVGAVYPGPVLAESGLGPVVPNPDRGPTVPVVNGSGHNRY
jgi:hypothetical protein